jgi:hypothetical protein
MKKPRQREFAGASDSWRASRQEPSIPTIVFMGQSSEGGDHMRTRILAACTLLAAFAAPAAAAEFYVVQNSGSKKCTIVEQKPVGQTMVVVGDGKVFTTRAEAESAMKTITVCKSN